MNNNIKTGFLVLVFIQGLHSIEEYFGSLWEVLPPATFLCGLFSDNLRTGFLIANIGLFCLGLIVWFYPVRNNFTSARGLIWIWVVIEIINGTGHPIWAFIEKSYVPGLITAPFLLIVALYLLKHLTELNRIA